MSYRKHILGYTQIRSLTTATRPKINFINQSIMARHSYNDNTNILLPRYKFIPNEPKFFNPTSFLIRPAIFNPLDVNDREEILDIVTEFFPDNWRLLPISGFLLGNLLLPNSHEKIDWKTTVIFNNYFDAHALYDRINPLIERAQLIYLNDVGIISDFTQSGFQYQRRYFSTEIEPPVNPKEYESKTLNYSGSDNSARSTDMSIATPLINIIPDIDYYDYTPQSLLQLTVSRQDDINEYLDRINDERAFHPKLSNDNTFENLRTGLLKINDFANVLFSIDLEAYEKNNNIITEIGITIYDPIKEAGSIVPNLTKIHIIIKEYHHLTNGTFVSDNQQYFIGGNSIILPQREASLFVQSLIDHYFILRQKHNMRGVIVGHNVNGDLRWLENMGVRFPDNSVIFDTQKFYTSINGDKFSGLGAVLRRCQIPHSYLHNAGNDSYFTLLLALKLCDVSFRDRIGLDDFNSDVKFLDDFKNIKQELGEKSEKQKNRLLKMSKNNSKRIKTRTNSYDFAKDLSYGNYETALKNTFEV